MTARIAIVGAGVSGLVCAYLLHSAHDVVIYESDNRIGGHSNTVSFDVNGEAIPVDTGFIVYNEKNYPNFSRLLERIGAPTKDSTMSFSVRDDRDPRRPVEYGGASLNAVFAQRANVVRPSFLRMIGDIRRFYREATSLVEHEPDDQTLAGFLHKHHYSDEFAERFLIPMAAAIWSSPLSDMRDFPLKFLVRFFDNHGMLTFERPQWRTIDGGSKEYVRRLIEPFKHNIRTNAPVDNVERDDEGVTVWSNGASERYDQVIFACHSDQALRMLAEPTPNEHDILSLLPYRPSDVVLHDDESILPRRRLAWSAWNYRLLPDEPDDVAVTYDMTILQSLPTDRAICVTLNQTKHIDPDRIQARYTYHHPVFTHEGLAAQQRYDEVGGRNRTHYCGAYWFNGFHEDGVRSALRVCEHFGATLS